MLITSRIICRVYLGFSKVAFYSVVIYVYRADFKTSQTFKGLYQGMVTFLPFPLSLERPVILIDLCHYLQAMLNQIIATKGLQKLDNISSEACPVSGSGSPVVVQLPYLDQASERCNDPHKQAPFQMVKQARRARQNELGEVHAVSQ